MIDRKLRKLRERHIKHGHSYDNSTRIDKLRSELHPKNCEFYIFTVNIMKCEECGLIYLDSGMEFRKPLFVKAPPHE